MKISVITVCYNNLEGLKRTLPSVATQTYDDYEMIVIDGGSTDGSKEYIQSIERIDYWVSEPDRGIYHAMNKGIDAAHGEYCIFMNSGDTFFSSQALENVADKLVSKDFYVARSTFFQDNVSTTCIPPEKMTIHFILSNALNHQGSFIRTAFLKENHYDETIPIQADWELFGRKWLRHECTYEALPIMTSIYYLDGISTIKLQEVQDERPGLVAEIVKTLPEGAEKRKYEQEIKKFQSGQEPWGERRVGFIKFKVDRAMELSPLLGDWKILRNGFRMLVKDLFSFNRT